MEYAVFYAGRFAKPGLLHNERVLAAVTFPIRNGIVTGKRNRQRILVFISDENVLGEKFFVNFRIQIARIVVDKILKTEHCVINRSLRVIRVAVDVVAEHADVFL